MDRSGIYRIFNTQNNMMYIGATTELKERKWHHSSALKRGVHKNKNLQKDYDKYGKNAFRFEILIICDSEMLPFFESGAIEKFQILGLAYNEEGLLSNGKAIRPRNYGNTYNLGKKRNQETKDRQSKSQIKKIENHNYNGHLNPEAIKVIKYMQKYQNYKGLQTKLSNLYKVSRPTLCDIKFKRIWKQIEV